MENSEIINGNKLIANFMGGIDYLMKQHWKGLMSVEAELYYPEEMQFHKRWDWLMPVVEKIETICGESNIVKLHFQNNHICYFRNTHNIEVGKRGENISKIKAVYTAVINFIEFQNERGEKI